MSQPNPSSWKQEVNLRLAAHKSRRGPFTGLPAAPVQMQPSGTSRAAQAAARVAARYAQAPSYSEMQAAEARVAVCTAEIATQVALQAQATAQAVLASMGAAAVEAPARQPEEMRSRAAEKVIEVSPASLADLQPPTPQPAAPEPSSHQTTAWEGQRAFGLRWEPDMPARRTEMGRASHGREDFEISTEDWWSPAEAEPMSAVVIEPAQPIPANLIEFPREMVATRKVRPRRVEGEFACTGGSDGQLSIFEVDPEAISTQPEAAPVAAQPMAMWPGMELEANPLLDDAEPEPARFTSSLQLAPMNRRAMAVVVDGALITGIFLAAVLLAGSHVKDLPSVKELEMGVAAALAVLTSIYQILFFALAGTTPGMKYAGISLCTFDDQFPTRARLFARLGALLLSLLPLGLGVAWALFDEEHLCWHDRITKTYQRKG
jgi:uncharacterized RDD family membrane protein YckC